MVTPLDVIPSVRQALRNGIKSVDDAACGAAAGNGNLESAVKQLRLFNEVLKWHADGEDELVFPAIEKVAPLAAKTYAHDLHKFDALAACQAKIAAASDALQPGRQLH